MAKKPKLTGYTVKAYIDENYAALDLNATHFTFGASPVRGREAALKLATKLAAKGGAVRMAANFEDGVECDIPWQTL